MDIYKRCTILAFITIMLCTNCIFLYITSGLFEVRLPWGEAIISFIIAYIVVWLLSIANPAKYDYSIVKFCFIIILTVVFTGSFLILREIAALQPEPMPIKPLPQKERPQRERFNNMRVIKNNKQQGFANGEIVVQFHDNTDQATAKALIESAGCTIKAFSWEKVHIAYITCPPGTENMKIAQLGSQVKWADRIRNPGV